MRFCAMDRFLSRRTKKNIAFLSEGFREYWTQVVVENVLKNQASTGIVAEESMNDDSLKYQNIMQGSPRFMTPTRWSGQEGFETSRAG